MDGGYNKDAIVYVEPNLIEYQYEDLSIFFMLIVDIPSRHKIAISDGCTIMWDGVRKKVNIVNGGKKYLTTFYTDLSYHDKFNGGDPEAFGIEDVSINYNTYYFPDVTIKFIDIRGSALFKSADLTREEETGPSRVSSFFQAFFTFPFPTFHMTVKGFFGKPVTYDMTAVDFKSRFNSASGNFEATVKFTGLVYGCLADIPMKYIITAPFYKGAEGLLGTFSDTTIDIPTIPGLIDIITHGKASIAESLGAGATASPASADLGPEGSLGTPDSGRDSSVGRTMHGINDNARDLGGLPLVGGGTTLYNVIFRGGSSTPEKLLANGITAEVAVNGHKILRDSDVGGCITAYNWANWGSYHRTESLMKDQLEKCMLWANNRRKIYVHCSRGCDRTGEICFILEMLAGVTFDGIKADYLYSNTEEARTGHRGRFSVGSSASAMYTYKDRYGATQDAIYDDIIRRWGIPEETMRGYIKAITGHDYVRSASPAPARVAALATPSSTSSDKIVILGDSNTVRFLLTSAGGGQTYFQKKLGEKADNIDAYAIECAVPGTFYKNTDGKPADTRSATHGYATKIGTTTSSGRKKLKDYGKDWIDGMSSYSGGKCILLLGGNGYSHYKELCDQLKSNNITPICVRIPKKKAEAASATAHPGEPNWENVVNSCGGKFYDLFNYGPSLKFDSDGIHYKQSEDGVGMYCQILNNLVTNVINGTGTSVFPSRGSIRRSSTTGPSSTPGSSSSSSSSSSSAAASTSTTPTGSASSTSSSSPTPTGGASEALAMRQKIMNGELSSTYPGSGRRIVLHRYALATGDDSKEGTIYGVMMGFDGSTWKYLADSIESKFHVKREGGSGNWGQLKPQTTRVFIREGGSWSRGGDNKFRTARRGGNSLLCYAAALASEGESFNPTGSETTAPHFSAGVSNKLRIAALPSAGILVHIGKRNGDKHYDDYSSGHDPRPASEADQRSHEQEFTRGCILIGGDISGYNGFADYPDEIENTETYPNCDKGVIDVYKKLMELKNSGNKSCIAYWTFYSFFRGNTDMTFIITGHTDDTFSELIHVQAGATDAGMGGGPGSGGGTIRLKASLGFDPSIRRMFEIILAHLRLFVSIYGSLIEDITNKTDGSRNVGGSIIENTDIYGNNDSVVGPFPGVFNPDGPNGPEYMWLGDHDTFKDYEEVGFINEFYRAAKLGYQKYEDAFKTLDSLQFLNQMTTPEFRFIPTMLTDFFHSGTNPYQDIFTMGCGKNEALIYAFYTRYALFRLGGDCSIFLSQDGVRAKDRLTIDDAKRFAVVEAYNVYLSNSGFKPTETGVRDATTSVMRILAHDETCDYNNFPLNHPLICGEELSTRFVKAGVACDDAYNPELTPDNMAWVRSSMIPFSYQSTLKTLLIKDFDNMECGITVYQAWAASRNNIIQNLDMLYSIAGFTSNSAVIIEEADYNAIAASINTIITKNASADYDGIGFEHIPEDDSDTSTATDTSTSTATATPAASTDLGSSDGTFMQEYGKCLNDFFNITTNERKYWSAGTLTSVDISDANVYYDFLDNTTNTKELDGFTVFAEMNGILDKPRRNWAFTKFDDSDIAALLLIDASVKLPWRYSPYNDTLSIVLDTEVINGEPSGLPFEFPSAMAALIGACCDPKTCEVYLERGSVYHVMTELSTPMSAGERWSLTRKTMESSGYHEFSLGSLIGNCNYTTGSIVEQGVDNITYIGGYDILDNKLCDKINNPLWFTNGTLNHRGYPKHAFYNFYKDKYLPRFKVKLGELKALLKKEHFGRKTMTRGDGSTTTGLALNAEGLKAVSGWTASLIEDRVAVMYPFYIVSSDTTNCVEYGDTQKPNPDFTFSEVYETFIGALGQFYGEDIKTKSESVVKSAIEERERSATKDQLKSMYLVMKNLFDRWHLNNETLELMASPELDFGNFKFYDSFRNDIGNTVMVDPIDFIQLCQRVIDSGNENSEGMSVYAFMEELCKMQDMVFFSLPMDIFEETSTYETVQGIFEPMSYCQMSSVEPNTTTFICMYPNKFSEHLNTREMGGEYADDGADFLHDTDILAYMGRESLEDGEERQVTKKLPLFGVTPGYQDQHIFKSVSIGMENPKNTSYSLMSTQFISNKNKERELSSIGYVGQNTYNVYATTSYSCDVEMLGDSCIMPSMYFQLNNIPLFNGTYMITTVSHRIHSGQMTTKFTGMRMNKHCLEYSQELLDLSGLVVAYNVGNFVSGSGGVVPSSSSVYLHGLSGTPLMIQVIKMLYKEIGVTNPYFMGGIFYNVCIESGWNPIRSDYHGGTSWPPPTYPPEGATFAFGLYQFQSGAGGADGPKFRSWATTGEGARLYGDQARWDGVAQTAYLVGRVSCRDDDTYGKINILRWFFKRSRGCRGSARGGGCGYGLHNDVVHLQSPSASFQAIENVNHWVLDSGILATTADAARQAMEWINQNVNSYVDGSAIWCLGYEGCQDPRDRLKPGNGRDDAQYKWCQCFVPAYNQAMTELASEGITPAHPTAPELQPIDVELFIVGANHFAARSHLPPVS